MGHVGMLAATESTANSVFPGVSLNLSQQKNHQRTQKPGAAVKPVAA